jgi:hypothetical protein
MTELRAWSVWDAGIRRFHWINLLCMLGLVGVGLVILNSKALGVPTEGKILLKTVHVWIGYVFALNLDGDWCGHLPAGSMRAGAPSCPAGMATWPRFAAMLPVSAPGGHASISVTTRSDAWRSPSCCCC